MAKYKLTLNLEWELEIPDNDLNEVDLENELLELLSERIYMANESVETLFWEGIEVERID
jgi:hypothetical protein